MRSNKLKIRIAIVSLVIVALNLLCVSCSSSIPPNNQPQQTLVHHTLNLVNRIITVKAGSWYSTSFTVSGSPLSEMVRGSFTASGGSGNDIIALILDDMAYTNWSNGHQVSTLYNSGQVTVANINVPITTAGTYHLIFSNTFSTFSSKEVNTKVDAVWDQYQ